MLEIQRPLKVRMAGQVVSLPPGRHDLPHPYADRLLRKAPEAVRLVVEGACGACRGTNFWYSVHGAVVCWTCHPPADPDLVAWWML